MRRSKDVSGHVNFPVDSDKYVSTHEGGMIVKLVAVPLDDIWEVCASANITDVHKESLVGSDYFSDSDSADKFHLPNGDNPRAKGVEKYLTRGYRAVIILGCTGWSGYYNGIRNVTDPDGSKHTEVDGEHYWKCEYSDLTHEGKNIYDLMRRAYPDCRLELLTILDT